MERFSSPPGQRIRVLAFLLDQRRHDLFRVAGHDPEPVVQNGPCGVHVDGCLAGRSRHFRTRVERFGQSQRLQNANPGPAHIELPRLDGKLRRVGIGVVIVVQLFAAYEDGPRHDIARGVRTFEVPITPVMANAIDDAGGEERNAHHLQRPHGGAERAEQKQVENQQRTDAQNGVRPVDIPFHPIVRGTPAVFLKRLLGDGVAVMLGTMEDYGSKTVNLRTVRIVFGLGQGMVLAVNRRPDLGRHAGSQPQPEAEKVLRRRMQIEGSVRGVAVQIDGYGDQCDVAHGKQINDHDRH